MRPGLVVGDLGRSAASIAGSFQVQSVAVRLAPGHRTPPFVVETTEVGYQVIRHR